MPAMRRMLQIAANKPQASASTAQASAAVPSSGLTSADNFQGASTAAAQLSAELGDVVGEVDLNDNLSASFRQLILDLDDEASAYQNSGISDEETYTQWQCSQKEAQVVSAAWSCAHGAYDLDADIVSTTDCAFETRTIANPSLGGTIKALTSTIVTSVKDGERNELLPVLIIAIRGSASKMDQIVNANEGPRRASHFIDPRISINSELMAHAGFLNCAEALSDTVLQNIRKFSQSRVLEKSHILFTGHSAGGAVASLLFLHYISKRELGLNMRLSCVTFGAPPSITGPIDISKIESPSSSLLALDIINEFDLVSRADRPYILSLVNLLRSKHGQPPLPSEPGAEYTDEDHLPKSLLEDINSVFETNSDSSPLAKWPVPNLFYHQVGLPIVFMIRLNEKDLIQLRAIEVPIHRLEGLLFCRLSMHRRSCYAERIQLLEQGKFNGRAGWLENC